MGGSVLDRAESGLRAFRFRTAASSLEARAQSRPAAGAVAGEGGRSFNTFPAAALAVLPDGSLAVYSPRYARIAVYSPEGVLARQWMSLTSSIHSALAVEPERGWLLTLLATRGQVARYTFDGRLAGPLTDLPRPTDRHVPNPRQRLDFKRADDGTLLVAAEGSLQALRWTEEGGSGAAAGDSRSR